MKKISLMIILILTIFTQISYAEEFCADSLYKRVNGVILYSEARYVCANYRATIIDCAVNRFDVTRKSFIDALGYCSRN